MGYFCPPWFRSGSPTLIFAVICFNLGSIPILFRIACPYLFFYNLLCCLVVLFIFCLLELVANPVYFMSWVQDSSLALQVLTNIETYLVEEEIRMVKLDKNCKYIRKNYIQYFYKIYQCWAVLSIRIRILIRRIRMFLDLPYPSLFCTDPYPDPSIIKQRDRKKLSFVGILKATDEKSRILAKMSRFHNTGVKDP